MPKNITYVAVVDDNPIYRLFAKNRISEIANCVVTVEAGDGQELIDKIGLSTLIPHVCVMDLLMPVMDGYETIKVLNKQWPKIKTLVVSQYCQPYAVENMIAMGAKGFISKEEMLHSLPDAIYSIVESGFFYSKMVGHDSFAKVLKNDKKPNRLTHIEKEILLLLCKNMQYDQIASALSISKRTIEKHKENISQKTGISSKEGLILFAIRNELANIS